MTISLAIILNLVLMITIVSAILGCSGGPSQSSAGTITSPQPHEFAVSRDPSSRQAPVSLEEAVAREVAEEAGVEVGEPRYVGSQPWPFPSSLMLGFTVPWISGEPPGTDPELEDVRWFVREEVLSATAQTVAGLPRLSCRASGCANPSATRDPPTPRRADRA